MSMSDKIIGNLVSEKPILQQDKSQLITNPFIPQTQQIKELEDIQNKANSIIEDNYNQNKTSSIADMSLNSLNTNLSSSFIGFMDDLFIKPNDIPWTQYLPLIIQKEQRYAYLGIFLIFIALYFLISK
jgi:hypothetical protein